MPILFGLTSSTVQPCLFNYQIVSFFSHQQAPQFICSSHSQAPQSSSSIITLYNSSPTNKASSIITPYHSALPLQSSNCLILLPPASSAVHPFKSFTSSTVFLFNHHTVSFFSHQQGIFNHHTISFFSHQQGIFNHHTVSFFSH